MLFQIKSRFSGLVQVEVEITCRSDASEATKLGKAVLAAIAQGAYLSGANLSGANLYGANLSGANLSGANLYGAYLSGANLSGANLYGANLYGAYLSGANLSSAYLSSAYLSGANLSGANLSSAYLSGANLSGANLHGANLYGAYLRSANLSGADLRSAENISELNSARHSIVPSEGAFIGWKKCRNGVLVKLQIPADARRSNATGRKCRAEFVEVLEVIGDKVGVSLHDDVTAYKAGATVRADVWCDDRWQECAGGIHFYISRVEAQEHC